MFIIHFYLNKMQKFSDANAGKAQTKESTLKTVKFEFIFCL
jgi:hypothetical protein